MRCRGAIVKLSLHLNNDLLRLIWKNETRFVNQHLGDSNELNRDLLTSIFVHNRHAHVVTFHYQWPNLLYLCQPLATILGTAFAQYLSGRRLSQNGVETIEGALESVR